MSRSEEFAAGQHFLAPVEELHPTYPQNPRHWISEWGQARKHKTPQGSHKALMRDIEKRGLQKPIEVRRTPQGLQVIEGHHRWAAAQDLGMTHIPAIWRRDEE